MTDKFKELFNGIESHDFRFVANQAAGLKMLKRIIREQETFTTLQGYAKDVSGARNVLRRILDIASFETDIRYENPHDTALATYLFVLDTVESQYASIAAHIIAEMPRLWWVSQISREILGRKQIRNASQTQIMDVSVSTQSKPQFKTDDPHVLMHMRFRGRQRHLYFSETIATNKLAADSNQVVASEITGHYSRPSDKATIVKHVATG
jgi:hypothetical protein